MYSYIRGLDKGPLRAYWDGEGYVLAVTMSSVVDPGSLNVTTVRISSGQSQSNPINLMGATLYKIVFPTAWTAASLTFLESETEAGTYTPVYGATDEYAITTAGADRTVRVRPADFLACKWLRLRSGTAASPVNQAGDRDILVYSYNL